MVFALILALAIAIVAVIFALQNPTIVTVSLFGYPVEGSLALVILIAVAVGILIGVLVMAPGRIRSSLSNARNRKKIDSLESSLEEQNTKLSQIVEPSKPDKEEIE
ncbi:MAG: LapA family protein [Anaerolineales bacterium]